MKRYTIRFLKKVNSSAIILMVLIFPVFQVAAEQVINVHRTILNATVVASACHVNIEADAVGNNQLSFGVYNKNTNQPIVPRSISLRMYESGSSLPGCSAFLVGQIASIDFGNPGQLDEQGIVTSGAGDSIRIELRSMDKRVDSQEVITVNHHTVTFPTDFASAGEFFFQAKPIGLEKSTAGEYNGSLSFIVSYQ